MSCLQLLVALHVISDECCGSHLPKYMTSNLQVQNFLNRQGKQHVVAVPKDVWDPAVAANNLHKFGLPVLRGRVVEKKLLTAAGFGALVALMANMQEGDMLADEGPLAWIISGTATIVNKDEWHVPEWKSKAKVKVENGGAQ